MADWDVLRTGYLTFDAFMSIFSMFLKKQETEVEFMNDFKRFCPKFVAETDLDDADKSQLVQAHNIMDVFFGLKLPMTKEIAEEMVFDADLDHNDGVSYDDLICAISTIGINEVYNAMEGDQQGLRVVQEIKRIEQFDFHRAGRTGMSPRPNPYLESKVNLRKRTSPPMGPKKENHLPNRVGPPADYEAVNLPNRAAPLESKVNLRKRTSPPMDFEKVNLPNRAGAAPPADLEEVYHLPNRADPRVDLDFEMNLPNRPPPPADFEKENLPNRADPPAEFVIPSRISCDFLSDGNPDDSNPTAHLL